MKISLGQNQWFDGEGKPLAAGRISVYVHGSDTPKEIFTLDSGDVFTQATNPYILDDAGRAPTLWFDAATVDVKVEAYNGVPGSYSLVDTYQDGFDMTDGRNDTLVYGITGLKETDTGLGTVTVVGFNSATDCAPRAFVWDQTCTAASDGCAIVESDVDPDGRWILLCDSRYMPSSFYGIVPGTDEANVGAFLTYQDRVGQWNIQLPPVPRFRAGTYVSAGTFSTLKTLSFDTGAKFLNATFSCPSAEVMHCNDFVADFVFSDQHTAESAWFRTAKKFWQCGAREMHQSRNNHFSDNSTGSVGTVCASLKNQKVTGTAMSLSGEGRINFESCVIDDGALSTKWYTGFSKIVLSDRWFADSDWAVGQTVFHRQLADSSTCTLAVPEFLSADVYLLFASAWGIQEVDLLGRAATYVTAGMPFNVIRNGSFVSMAIEHDTRLENVRTNSLHLTGADFTLKDCDAVLAYCTAASLTVDGGSMRTDCDIDISTTAVTMEGCSVNLNSQKVRPAQDNWNLCRGVSLVDCVITGGNLYANSLYMRGCRVNGARVKVYPYADSGTWKLNFDVGGCSFTGDSGIDIGADHGDGVQNPFVFDVVVEKISIVGNQFLTSSNGLTCPFWGADGYRRFLRGIVRTMGWIQDSETTDWYAEVLYSGNTGNCPAQYGKPSRDFNSLEHLISYDSPGDTGTSKHIRFPVEYAPQSVFVLPVTWDDGGANDGDNHWIISDTAKGAIPYEPRFTYFSIPSDTATPALFPYVMYTPECAWDRSLANDMFTVRLGASTNLVFHGAMPVPSQG